MEDTSHPTLAMLPPPHPQGLTSSRWIDMKTTAKSKNTQASKQANPKLQAETVLCQWNNDAQITKRKAKYVNAQSLNSNI